MVHISGTRHCGQQRRQLQTLGDKSTETSSICGTAAVAAHTAASRQLRWESRSTESSHCINKKGFGYLAIQDMAGWLQAGCMVYTVQQCWVVMRNCRVTSSGN